LHVINEYASITSKINERGELTGFSLEDLMSTAMLIGYLLKGHVDRCELQEVFKNGK
jgi:hypothetical protein